MAFFFFFYCFICRWRERRGRLHGRRATLPASASRPAAGRSLPPPPGPHYPSPTAFRRIKSQASSYKIVFIPVYLWEGAVSLAGSLRGQRCLPLSSPPTTRQPPPRRLGGRGASLLKKHDKKSPKIFNSGAREVRQEADASEKRRDEAPSPSTSQPFTR